MEIVACKTCRDFKRVYDGGPVSVPCPECSTWPPEKRIDLLREATRRDAQKPSITESDLSDSEKELMAKWSDAHPNVHKLTLLTWIEGRRYDPKEDPEFLAEARKAFKKWHFLRNETDGPIPDWAKTALATGQTSHLTKNDREYVEALRVQK